MSLFLEVCFWLLASVAGYIEALAKAGSVALK